jgi:hypothetical protein
VVEEMTRASVLLLFGLPCVGKTSFANEAKALCPGVTVFGVDRTIRSVFGREPCKEDFLSRAPAVLADLERRILDIHMFVIVEMGCLLPRVHVEAFVAKLRLTRRVLAVELTCDGARTRERAADRNLRVLKGQSDAVVIDNPDAIHEFATVYERPAGVIILESDYASPVELVQRFLALEVGLERCHPQCLK